MPANRHQRRAYAARVRRPRTVDRPARPPARRFAAGLAGLALLALTALALSSLHGGRVPRAVLLLPILALGLLVIAFRG